MDFRTSKQDVSNHGFGLAQMVSTGGMLRMWGWSVDCMVPPAQSATECEQVQEKRVELMCEYLPESVTQ